MTGTDDLLSIEAYARENREKLKAVLRHSDDTFARACAWVVLDAGSDPVELAQLQQELAVLQEQAAD